MCTRVSGRRSPRHVHTPLHEVEVDHVCLVLRIHVGFYARANGVSGMEISAPRHFPMLHAASLSMAAAVVYSLELRLLLLKRMKLTARVVLAVFLLRNANCWLPQPLKRRAKPKCARRFHPRFSHSLEIHNHSNIG